MSKNKTFDNNIKFLKGTASSTGEKAYPEIKVPQEFIIKFEINKSMAPGSTQYANREMHDEIRIRYLQNQNTRLEEFYTKEMRELEIRLRNKMHGYARACLETIGDELKKDMK